MFCSVLSAVIAGVDAIPVSVEADVSSGMPVFNMVGFISAQVREAQERVRTALRNLGISLPPQRITINLAPGGVHKDGTSFDLPIAASVLEALGYIPPAALEKTMILGELHLDGTVEKITGVLPCVLVARKYGCKLCIVPLANVREAEAVEGIEVRGISSLQDLLHPDAKPVSPPVENSADQPIQRNVDFQDIRGQQTVKRAALIAAAGFHNLLLSGPPGSGKSMTAERIPGIMPPLDKEESLEISKIYSIAGMLPDGGTWMKQRPFRAPHHTITPSALCGGGLHPKPGEVTLAHRGVLFLDEIPEMRTGTLEMLRQPLEERKITISRMGGSYTFPASFLLVAAMNNCPCGRWPSSQCICSPREIMNYQARVSQALLDRIDLRCEVPPASYAELNGKGEDEISSAKMRKRVMAAVERQKERFKKNGIHFNSELKASDMDQYCPMTSEGKYLLQQAFEKLGMSARAYHHVIKVARTIADLDGADIISEDHVSEALCYRCSSETEAVRRLGHKRE